MPRIDKCVRCGAPGRHLDSFLCARCYGDPARLAEQRAVEAAEWGNYQAMRAMLGTKFGWTGPWGRHETEGE